MRKTVVSRKIGKRALSILLIVLILLGLLLPVGAYTASAMPSIQQQTIDRAYALNGLGLFQGTETGFELEKRATRLEGLVMLIRLLGEEQTAKTGSYTTPFTDVPTWGIPYVGYAYQNGLTKGTSPSSFGATTYITANDYATFALRALGHSDTNGDFSWSSAAQSAMQYNIVTQAQVASWNQYIFVRGDMVDISLEALKVPLKGQSQTLSQKLVEKGIFTEDAAKAAKVWIGETTSPLSITPTTAICGVGTTVNLMASGATGSVQWSSSSPNATLISSGPSAVVTGVKAGTATIIASTNGKTASATITITAQTPQASLLVNPTLETCPKGSTVLLTALLQNAEQDPSITWSSDTPSVATVSSSGEVTGVSAGSAKITATVNDLKLAATATITVTDVASVQSITSLKLSQTALSLDVGASSTVTATVLPTDASNKSLTWKSSHPAIASVSAGRIQAVAAGTATITATAADGSGKSAAVTVTVKAKKEEAKGPTVIDERVLMQEGCYSISPSENTKFTMDIDAAATENETRVQLYEDVNVSNQKFNLFHESNAFYLQPTHTNTKALDLKDATLGSGLHLWDLHKKYNQLLFVSKFSDGTFALRSNANIDLAVAVDQFSNGSKLKLVKFNPQDSKQHWNFERLGAVNWSIAKPEPPVQATAPLADGLYTIKVKTSGNFLDVNGGADTNGAKIQLWEENGTSAQIFRLKNLGGAKYKLYPYFTKDKVLDINRGNSATAPLRLGLNANIWTETDPAAQEFLLELRWDGYYTISLAALPNGALSANDWRAGTQITLDEYIGGAHQHWMFTPTNGPTVTPPPSQAFVWPASGPITCAFNGYPGHSGLDIGTYGKSAPVVTSQAGTVIAASSACSHDYNKNKNQFCYCNDGYGRYVKIRHADGKETLYAHLRSLSVSKGATVSQGQQIGMTGTTGNSSGIHLHFEIRVNGKCQDPKPYLP